MHLANSIIQQNKDISIKTWNFLYAIILSVNQCAIFFYLQDFCCFTLVFAVGFFQLYLYFVCTCIVFITLMCLYFYCIYFCFVFVFALYLCCACIFFVFILHLCLHCVCICIMYIYSDWILFVFVFDLCLWLHCDCVCSHRGNFGPQVGQKANHTYQWTWEALLHKVIAWHSRDNTNTYIIMGGQKVWVKIGR